jgi:hypothetical protein
MTKREYLISLGLAKPGRGRFSREGNAAIAKAESEGIKFDDPDPKNATPHEAVVSVVDTPKPIKAWTVARDYNVMRGTTDEGWVIEWGMCDRCARSIMYCPCSNGPSWPPGVTGLVEHGTLASV